MARLASIEKGQYYPTPTTQITKIANVIINQMSFHCSGGTIFDNCIGSGTAAAHLAAELERYEKDHRERYPADTDGKKVKPWTIKGIEIDAERAAQAAELFGENNIIQTGIEAVHIAGKSDIVFCNPPYDGTDSQRAEIPFIKQAAATANRLLILVLKDQFFINNQWSEQLRKTLKAAELRPIYCARFTNPEYNQFHQAVLICEPGYFSRLPDCIDDLDTATARRVWINTRKQCPTLHIIKTEADNNAGSILEENPAAIHSITGRPGESAELSPLLPMRTEHAALIASAGMLNGLEIDGKVIKGNTTKKILTHSREVIEGDRQHTEKTTNEVYTVTLTIFDTNTGELTSTNSSENPEEFKSLLTQYAQKFVSAARDNYPAAVTPADLARVNFDGISAPGTIPGRPRGLLDKQKETAAAIVTYWKRGNKAATIVGEMSTGKTLTSIAAAAIAARDRAPHLQKIVALIPAKKDLADKWQREAAAILADIPDTWTAEAESITDIKRLFARPGIGLIVIRETMAKASTAWYNLDPADLPTRKIKDYSDTGKLYYKKLPACPHCNAILDIEQRKDTKKWTCENCSRELWSFTRPEKTRRYPLARYIRDHHARQYILIMDEAHNYKSGDTNRGYASQDLISGAHKAVQMTGTIFSGMASSIFFLLYRTSPAFRKLYNHRDVQKFIDSYGLRQTVTKTYQEKHTRDRVAGYKEITSTPQERPGINPKMAALLLNCSGFMALRDFDYIMPSYSEYTLMVEPDAALIAPYSSYISSLKSAGIQQKLQEGKAELLCKWQWARYGILDRPDTAETIGPCSYTPPADCRQPFAKESALIRLVKREADRGRACLCFVQQIDRRDPTRRLSELLARHGLQAATMRADVKNRIDYIRASINSGANVIFCSASLVSEGVDIIETPSIIWYGHEFNTYIMPQSNRRSYRLQQTEPVEIYYLAYNQTPQAAAMYRIAQKLKAQQALQGDTAHGLAKLLSETEIYDNIQAETCEEGDYYETDITPDDLPELPEELNPAQIDAAAANYQARQAIQAKRAKEAAAKEKAEIRRRQLAAKKALQDNKPGNRDARAIIERHKARGALAEAATVQLAPATMPDAAPVPDAAAQAQPQAPEPTTPAFTADPEPLTVETYSGALFDLDAIAAA